MKECWINVYTNGFGRHKHLTLNDAIAAADFVKTVGTHKLLYRIHVRMK